jgi:hypothetical protein
MESINALLIRQGLSQGERLLQLNSVAITQMKSLVENKKSETVEIKMTEIQNKVVLLHLIVNKNGVKI